MYSLSMARKCEAIYEILTPTITVCGFVLKPAAVHCCQTTGFHFGCELKRQHPGSRGPFSEYLRVMNRAHGLIGLVANQQSDR